MRKSVIFFGSSAYSVPVLETLLDAKITIPFVITTPDQPAGRHLQLTPNPLKQFAATRHLTLHTSLPDPSLITPHSLALVAAYGKIIPPETLDTFNGQIYNIHPSLLPKYRGPSPLQQQILDGASPVGVTVIQIDAQMDHGPIVVHQSAPLHPTDTPETLGRRLFIQGTHLFISHVLDSSPQLTPQDHSQATYTRKLTRQDGFLPYPEYQAQSLHPTPDFVRKFNAYYPWPGIWTVDPTGRRLKLTRLPSPS